MYDNSSDNYIRISKYKAPIIIIITAEWLKNCLNSPFASSNHAAKACNGAISCSLSQSPGPKPLTHLERYINN